METVFLGVHGCCLCTQKVFSLQNNLSSPTNHTTLSCIYCSPPRLLLNFSFSACGPNISWQRKGLQEIVIDFSLKQLFLQGSQAQGVQLQIPEQLPRFYKHSKGYLQLNNMSRTSHFKVLQKCTQPSFYSYCWKALPLENRNLGSKYIWTRDI